MNYKKSILSVVLWFIYAIIVGTGMVGTAMAVTLPAYGALIITGVWLAVTGLAVFLLHRFLEKTKHPFSGDRQQIKLIAESLLVVALIAAGIVLRTEKSCGMICPQGAGISGLIPSWLLRIHKFRRWCMERYIFISGITWSAGFSGQ